MKNIKYIALFLVFAFAGYYLTLWATPRAVLLMLKHRGKGTLNTPTYNDIISAKDRLVALPNPDFLYVAMGYDVRENDLIITSLLPDTSYYSISFYDTDTRCFYTANDKQLEGDSYGFRLSTNKAGVAGAENILARTTRGFVLVRILVTDRNRVEYLKEIQHSFKVEEVPKKL